MGTNLKTIQLTDEQSAILGACFMRATRNPYNSYRTFKTQVQDLEVPDFWQNVCGEIQEDRGRGVEFHRIRNLPVSETIKYLEDYEGRDPAGAKYWMQGPFVPEIILQSVSSLTKSPLMSYGGDDGNARFVHVYAQRGNNNPTDIYTAGDLIWHTDRVSKPIRPYYITLLGVDVPDEKNAYTCFAWGSDLRGAMSEENHSLLSSPLFCLCNDIGLPVTKPFAVFSKDNEMRFSSRVQPRPDLPFDKAVLAGKALHEFKGALEAAPADRVKIEKGDLLINPNKQTVHKKTVEGGGEAPNRRLLKTYGYASDESASADSAYFEENDFGMLDETRIDKAVAQGLIPG